MNKWNKRQIKDLSELVLLKNYIKKAKITFAGFDTETDGLILLKSLPRLLTFGWIEENGGKYVILIDINNFKKEELVPILQDIFRLFPMNIGHNVKFDMHMLANIGFNWEDIVVVDNMSIPSILFPTDNFRSLKLKDVTGKKVLQDDVKITLDKLHREWSKNAKKGIVAPEPNYATLVDSHPELMLEYAYNDVIDMLDYFSLHYPKVKDKKTFQIERDVIYPLFLQERRGIRLNIDYLQRCKVHIIHQIKQKYWLLYEFFGKEFKIGQHKVIKQLILEKYDLDLPSVDKMALLPYNNANYKGIQLICELRTLTKWLSTYIDRFLDEAIDGRFYPSYKQFGAITGRLSGDIQQLPRNPLLYREGGDELFHPKLAFLTDYFHVGVQFDYAAQEVRIAAIITMLKGYPEQNIIKALEDSTFDLHSQIPKTIYGEKVKDLPNFKEIRASAKKVFFAILYGSGKRGITSNPEMLASFSQQDLAIIYDSFEKTFPNLFLVKKQLQDQFQKNKEIKNLFGRTYQLETIQRDDGSFTNNAYKCLNYIIQGSAADILKMKMIDITKLLKGKKSHIIMNLHDAIYLQIYYEEQHLVESIKSILEYNPTLPLKLEVEKTEYHETWR